MLQFKLSIFYLSFLVFPFIILLFFKWKNWKKFNILQKIIFVIFILLSLIFIDSRFIEPNYISVENTKINIWIEEKVKIALISDIHLWIYKKWDFLEKIVKKINKIENLDYIFIAWDLTYFQNNQKNFELEKLFFSIKKINKPVYWVLGNHDVQIPWPKIREKLKKTLDNFWVNYLNNQIVKLKWFKLFWLWSNRNNEDAISLLDNKKPWEKFVVLTHNPDTILKYKNFNADLTLCGHTHWWQIKIPFLYKFFIPTNWDFDEWLTQEKYTKLFITSGVWVIWLPFRFLNPPVIDVLEIY